MNLIKPIAFAAVLFAASPLAIAASQADIDKLTTYAVVLGRAVACGASVDDASRRVGRWMDRTFPPGSKDQQTYLPIFTEGMRYHAQQQKDGKSPDSCSAVLRSFNSFLKFGYKISHGLRAHIVRECPGGGRGLEAYR